MISGAASIRPSVVDHATGERRIERRALYSLGEREAVKDRPYSLQEATYRFLGGCNFQPELFDVVNNVDRVFKVQPKGGSAVFVTAARFSLPNYLPVQLACLHQEPAPATSQRLMVIGSFLAQRYVSESRHEIADDVRVSRDEALWVLEMGAPQLIPGQHVLCDSTSNWLVQSVIDADRPDRLPLLRTTAMSGRLERCRATPVGSTA
jgi:hypothetical protein